MAERPAYNAGKLAQLMLYIASVSERDPRFGATKLAKLLYFADFEAYRELGKPITGAIYVRRPNGPMPHEFRPVREKLVSDRLAALRTEPLGDDIARERLIALQPADISAFSGEEISIVDKVIRTLWESTAAEVSDLSHQAPGWQFAKPSEEIPYEAACLPKQPTVFDEDEIAWAEEMASTL